MKKIIGFLKELSGLYYAKDVEGNLREIHPGDPVFSGEIVVNAAGLPVPDALRFARKEEGEKESGETALTSVTEEETFTPNHHQQPHKHHFPPTTEYHDVFDENTGEYAPEISTFSLKISDEFSDRILVEESTPSVGGHLDLSERVLFGRGMVGSHHNQAPIAQNDLQGIQEDTSTTGNVLSNDSDPEGDTLSVTAIRTGAGSGSGAAGTVGAALTGAYGTLTLNADGSYTYVADQAAADALAVGETATESFTYTVSDGHGGTDTAELTVTVTGTNDAPVITATDALNAQEDGGTVSGTVTFRDADLHDTHTFSVTQPSEGSVTIDANGTYTFDPENDFQDLAAGETRDVSFDVTVTDNHGASATQTVTVTVTGTNDAPVANLDGQTSIGVNLNGVDGALVYDSRGGNPELLGGAGSVDVSMTFRAEPGSRSLLSYASDDSSGNGGNEFLLFTNSAGTSLSLYVDGASAGISLGMSLYDGDVHTLRVSWDSTTGNAAILIDGNNVGTVTVGQGHVLGGNGVLMFGQEQDSTGGRLDPNQIFKGVYSDVEIAVDGSAVAHWEMDDINGGQVRDTVGGYDLEVRGDVEIYQEDQHLITDEDTPLQIDDSYLLANDTDIDTHDTLTITSVQDAVHGTVAHNGTTITFTPDADYNGPAQFTYTVSDGHGGSDTQTVYLRVDPVNDAPVAEDDSYQDADTDGIGVNLSGTDGALVYDSRGANPELLGGTHAVNVAMTIEGENGSNSLLSYAAPANNNEFLLFTNDAGTSLGVYIHGAHRNLSLGSSIYDGDRHRLEVDWDNTTGRIEVKVDGSVTDTDTLRQGYTLGSGGVLMLGQEQDSTGGSLDPNQIFKGVYSDVEIAVDGSTVAHWEMDGINGGQVRDTVGGYDLDVTGDVQEVSFANPLTTDEDTSLTIDTDLLTANDHDVDGDPLTVTQVSDTAETHGTVILNGDGTITYTPDTDYNGEAKFEYTVSDGNGGTDTATVTLNVLPVNDTPVIDHVILKQPARESMVFWDKMDEPASIKTDLAQNGHNATEVGSTGIYTIADDSAINTGTYDQKTIAVSFTTGSVSSSDPFQVIYEQGGAWNGYSVSVKGDHLYASVWGESYGTINPDYAIIDLGQISPNTDYSVVMAHDGTASNGGTLTAWIDGVQNPDVKTGVGQMGPHSGDVGIGGYKNDTIDPTNPTADVHGNGGQFKGTVHEVMSWNSAQSSVVNEANRYLNGTDDTTTALSATLDGIIELFDVDASDVEDGTNLTYALQNDFAGLFSVDAATGVVSVNADNLLSTNTYSLNVLAQDSQGATASTTLTVDVDGSEVVHLDMNGNTDDTADAGSVADNGQLHNGASVNNGDTLVLDGVNDYLDFANSADINQGTYAERSVSLWFKTTDGAGTQYLYAEGGGVRSLQIYTEDGVLKAKGYNDPDSENGWKSANATILDSGADVADGQWHHVTITTQGDPNDPLHGLAADGFRLYLDGNQVDSGTGGALYGHDNAHVGSYYNGSQTFEGQIEDVRIYNDALHDTQVTQLTGMGVLGTGGDDILTYDSSQLLFEGGAGDDTLLIPGSEAIDLSHVEDISNIERIQLQSGAGMNGTLSLYEILEMTDNRTHLTIDGDASSQITISHADFSQSGSAGGYDHYVGTSDPTVTLDVDQDIQVAYA